MRWFRGKSDGSGGRCDFSGEVNVMVQGGKCDGSGGHMMDHWEDTV